MTLVTGTPLGTITSQEDVYVEGAPNIYFQDASANVLKNPDSDGFYWGLSGTATYPVYELGCVMDVTFGDSLTMNAVRCDNIGDKGVIQKRDHLELNLTIQTLFPFSTLTPLIKGGTVTRNTSEHTEKFGMGQVNNNKYYHVYMPKVYDEDTGDYVVIHLHRAQFVDAFSLAMTYGENWKLSGLKIWAFADSNKPSTSQFATIIRADASVIT